MIEPTPTVMVVFGTRPEAIKVAPIIRALRADSRCRVIAVATAQHREMLDQVCATFAITPEIDLDLMVPRQGLNELASRVISKIDDALSAVSPDLVLVQGDTTTVMASSVAAFNRGIPVVHLEAGLRSGNIESPFPEEMNRKIVTQIAALHLAPTASARRNLLREGVADSQILVTGNTVIDALMWVGSREPNFADERLRSLLSAGSRFVLLTAHRRENIGSNMGDIGRGVRELARRNPDVTVVWPAHRNPAVRELISPHLAELENVLVVEPLGYAEFAQLIHRAHVVLTDSGGLQEEAPSVGTPVLVLRDNTERPEAVEAGAVRVIGTDPLSIVAEAERLLCDPDVYRTMSRKVDVYGDGRAADVSVEPIVRLARAHYQRVPRLHEKPVLGSAVPPSELASNSRNGGSDL